MGFGFVLALAGFIYVNRKKPEQVDKAEAFIRKENS